MKFTPKLHFKIDKGLQKVNRIEELLDEIEKQ
jgi:ribosome-binding factor A